GEGRAGVLRADLERTDGEAGLSGSTGRSGLLIRGEIIGGWETRPHSRPYMAYVQIATWRGVKTCGGFLIRDDVVLTAAHCNDNYITVKLGVHNLRLWEWSRQEIRRIPHPQYDMYSFNNDVMLLQLAHRARLNEWVGLIPLPSTWQGVQPGAMCSVAGWGRTSARSAKGSDVLQEVDVEVLEDYVCLRNPDQIYRYYNTSTMLCAGDPKQGKSSFKGDSGGPLVCGKTAQGIVSWDSPNGTPPAVYTRVSRFVPWILETMRTLQP
uniref:Peptidase S1 domain-containing protein n=1 Tax=Terrapene triunguis TaxID=2587831 RepID=A0A674JYT2_9SAUR